MSDDDGLVCAFVLDGEGGGKPVRWPGIKAWRPEDGTLWVHLDRSGAVGHRWLSTDSGVDPVICQALLEPAVRPRLVPLDGGVPGVGRPWGFVTVVLLVVAMMVAEILLLRRLKWI